MVETTISETTYSDVDGKERVQYRTTIPKHIAESLDLGDTTVEWKINDDGTITLIPTDD